MRSKGALGVILNEEENIEYQKAAPSCVSCWACLRKGQVLGCSPVPEELKRGTVCPSPPGMPWAQNHTVCAVLGAELLTAQLERLSFSTLLMEG